MKQFVKKATTKISKLSDEQVENLFSIIQGENDTLNCVMESLSTGLILVDNEWKVSRYNKACERILPFKIRPSDVKAENLPVWDLIDNPYIASFLEALADDKKTNVSEEFSYSTEDKNKFVNITVVPLVKKSYGEDKDFFSTSIEGSIISVDDVTEKRLQEILLHRMESLAGLTNLAASVAHEIKNPLGAISIHIQLIQKAINKARKSDGLLPEERHLEDYLGVVNEEIDNLNKIVLDFLFAVRPVQANMSLSDPDEVLEKTAQFFNPEFKSKGVKINLSLSAARQRILIDEKLFREVIVNLCQNALHAIQEKFGNTLFVDGEDPIPGYEGELIIVSKVKNDKYVLIIHDNGCGMDEKTAARIFEPYYTTKANGTGLGLTMVYKIIKEFRGDIDVKSTLNYGTTFKIVLPIPQKNTMLLASNATEGN